MFNSFEHGRIYWFLLKYIRRSSTCDEGVHAVEGGGRGKNDDDYDGDENDAGDNNADECARKGR